MSRQKRVIFAATAILWLVFFLLLGSAARKSATVDEQSHLFRGAAFLRAGATQFLLGHPLGAGTLSALPLLTEPDLRLPQESPAWAAGDWSVAGNLFLWQLNDNPQRLLFLGRLPVIFLTLILGAIVFRWGRQLAGPAAGLAGMTLLLLDPNVLAHGRLITGDLALTCFFTLTLYGYWRWATAPARAGFWSRRGALPVAGFGLGLAAISKYNAALLLPILLLLALYLCVQKRTWRPLIALLPVFITGGAVIWAANGLAMRPLPGGPFWDDLFWQLRYTGRGHGQYLFGQSSPDGWWYYFPVTFLLKTPLPTLLLLLLGAVSGFRKRPWRATTWFLLLPPPVILLASMSTALNIGVRYLIPMLPFLILAAVSALRGGDRPQPVRYAVAAGALAVAALSVTLWPDYLPYFNLFGGGGNKSWRLLSDSNVDWGQDLPALAAWQAQNNQTPYLSYFGTAPPSAYGVEAIMLPTWTPGPEQTPPDRQPFYPPQPAPGLYAISVTNLHGVVLGEAQDSFAWFRDREPVARLGGSIFIYEVPAAGPAVDVAFSGLVPAELDAALYARFGSNDLRPRWFDARTSLLWPAGGGWLAAGDDGQPPAALAPFWPQTAVAAADNQALYQVAAPPQALLTLPAVEFGPVRLRGWRQLAASDGEVALLTVWEVVTETERPLQIFVHALDGNGAIVGQWDGLHVPASYWRAGDIFVQSHSFAVTDMTAVQKIVTGMYDQESLLRLADPFTLME